MPLQLAVPLSLQTWQTISHSDGYWQFQFWDFAERLHHEFFEVLNTTLSLAFKNSAAFNDFLESVILHSLSVLLKNLVPG